LGQMNFLFSGEASKLQNAPAFSATSDLGQGNWSQRVYSHFGLSPSSATGGALAPGGVGTGSGTGSSQGTATPPSGSQSGSGQYRPGQPGSGSQGSSSGGSSSGGSSSGR
jgi:hypothetical protein